MINILKGISIALSGKGKQLLLGGAFVILPFLSFVWNGIWEYRILIFLAMMVLGAALLYCVEWLMSGKKVIGISRLDVAVGVYLVYCAINNLLHDNVFVQGFFCKYKVPFVEGKLGYGTGVSCRRAGSAGFCGRLYAVSG